MTGTDGLNGAGVGATLKKARTQRGLSLDSVGQKTRVPRKFLEALEAERYEELPAPVYVRGFLRTYCEFLDLDFDPLWAKVQASKEAPKAEAAPAPDVSESHGDAHTEEAPAPARAHAPAPAKKSASRPAAPANGPKAAPLAAVLGVAALGGLFFLITSARQPAAPQKEWTPAPPVTPLNAGKPIAVRLAFKARAWVQVSVDEKSPFEGWVPAGAAQDWSAAKSLRLRIDDPAKVEAEVDGVSAPLATWTRLGTGEYSLDNPN